MITKTCLKVFFKLVGNDEQPATVYVLQGGGDAESSCAENDNKTITISIKEGNTKIPGGGLRR